ncbi:MAG TPA: 2-hydroxymuconic semialdehyde dehydrogenase [Phycisphaerales bacterium]|nr:2-hydroxymuconic semialdehyde dehydrogenase [Phycisphaerales bacterium]
MLTVRNFINGQFTEPRAGRWLENYEPATGAPSGRLPDSDERDASDAIDAAARAFPAWGATPLAERARVLLRLADLIERDAEAIARAESDDTGKPIRLARSMDAPRAALNFRFFAGAATHWRSEFHRTDLPAEQHAWAMNYTLRKPVGVVGLISPWNLPIYLLSWKIAPAIASGNTCVCKPSELTPVTAHMLAALCAEAGVPPGVVNIVHGLGPKAGAPIVAHERTRAVSFTGGTATGRTIASLAAPRFKKTSLELGGKNPTIVFADADLERAVPEAVRAAFTNQGQVCLCGSRVLVERSIFDEFTRRFVERTRALRVGDPREDATDLGALISAAHREKVRGAIRLALQEGARVLLGGPDTPALPERCRDGFFLAPTVLVGLGPVCRTMQEEIFGPVVALAPFDDEADAIALANASPFGLSASVWTTDLSRAHRVAERLDAGTVWVNCWLVRDLRVPFGGVKQSGLGREGGEEALRFFSEPTNVCVRYET